MKTLLIPTEDHTTMPAVLDTACRLADRFDSYMEGFAVLPALRNFVAVDPVSSLAIASAKDADADIADHARVLFESYMQSRGVSRLESEDKPRTGAAYGWLADTPDGDEFIGSHGRVFDLIVLGRPGRDAGGPRMPPLEWALFESGRPVLIAPPQAPAAVGDNIVISWNGSTEQSRANAFAKPLLRLAKKVTVLTIEGGTTPGPTGAQVARQLKLNGIAAEAVTVAPGERSTGEAILEEAVKLGADLLVKGAYTQSRFRQMIFGGATRHILSAATLPILMAH